MRVIGMVMCPSQSAWLAADCAQQPGASPARRLGNLARLNQKVSLGEGCNRSRLTSGKSSTIECTFQSPLIAFRIVAENEPLPIGANLEVFGTPRTPLRLPSVDSVIHAVEFKTDGRSFRRYAE